MSGFGWGDDLSPLFWLLRSAHCAVPFQLLTESTRWRVEAVCAHPR
jgi:hypothetical protein